MQTNYSFELSASTGKLHQRTPDVDRHQLPTLRAGRHLTIVHGALERDGGTCVQCESISLTRGIPIGLGWLVDPLVTSIPRESLAFTLETTGSALARRLASQN